MARLQPRRGLVRRCVVARRHFPPKIGGVYFNKASIAGRNALDLVDTERIIDVVFFTTATGGQSGAAGGDGDGLLRPARRERLGRVDRCMSISWRGPTHCGFFLVPRGGGRFARQRSPPETLSHPLSHQNACKCSAGTSTSALCRYAALRTPAERLWLPNRGRGCHRTWVARWGRQRPHTLAARRSDPTQLCPPASRFFVLAIVWYFP